MGIDTCGWRGRWKGEIQTLQGKLTLRREKTKFRMLVHRDRSHILSFLPSLGTTTFYCGLREAKPVKQLVPVGTQAGCWAGSELWKKRGKRQNVLQNPAVFRLHSLRVRQGQPPHYSQRLIPSPLTPSTTTQSLCHGPILSLIGAQLLRTAASQASLSFTISQCLLKLMFIDLVMPSNHLILCHPLLLPSIFPSIRVFVWILC